MNEAPEPASAQKAPRGILQSRALPWLLFAGALVAAVAFGVLWDQARTEDVRRAEVEETARAFVAALTNFSSSTIEQDVAEIRSFATGAFENEVESIFSADTIRAIEEADTTSESSLEALAVQRIDDTSGTVYAVAGVTMDNARLEQPNSGALRMEIELVETEDGWKVSGVELLQSPGAPAPGPFG